MSADYTLLLGGGIVALVITYLARLVFPLFFSLMWQLLASRFPIEKLPGNYATPKSNTEFFYFPLPGDPLILRWYWPNHAKTIPISFMESYLVLESLKIYAA